MKQMSDELASHMGGEVTTLAQLIKITRLDGSIIGLSSHDEDLIVEGVSYVGACSFVTNSYAAGNEASRGHGEVEGILSSDLISYDDVKAGLYDYARLDHFFCNWRDVSQGVLHVKRGWLGAVTYEEGQFKAAFRSFSDLLEERVGDFYTPECRYDFGGTKCGYDVSGLAVSGRVTSLQSEQTFVDYTRGEEEGAFNDGVLCWTSGANSGTCQEVYKWTFETQSMELWIAPDHPIAIGDTYDVTQACDKRFSTCCTKFNNAARFGGFPHLPGIGKIMDYPDQR